MPFTVFAPTDLLKPENKAKLQSILTCHVVPDRVMAADIVKVKEAKTVNGAELQVKAGPNGVMVDNANVVKTDILTSNRVMHVIDSVFLAQ